MPFIDVFPVRLHGPYVTTHVQTCSSGLLLIVFCGGYSLGHTKQSLGKTTLHTK